MGKIPATAASIKPLSSHNDAMMGGENNTYITYSAQARQYSEHTPN